MLNSSRWLAASLLIALSCVVPLAAAIGVNSADAFRDALLDASTSSIVLEGPVILDPGSFDPVSLTRAVSITAATPAAYLDLGSAQEPLISIEPWGNLTFQSLQLVNFHAQLPLPLSQASSIMPLSAITSSSNSAHLVLSRCVLLVNGAANNVTDTMPFWAARQQASELNTLPSTALPFSDLPSALGPDDPSSSTGQQAVALINSISSAPFSGSSRTQVVDSVVVFDSVGCVRPGQLLAWGSQSLSQALASAPSSSSSGSSGGGPPTLLLLSNITLSPKHWTLPRSGGGNTPSLTITACNSSSSNGGPTVLDLGSMPGVFLLEPGSTLTFTGDLLLQHAAAVSQAYTGKAQDTPLSWPYSNRSSSALTLLLLGSVDVSQGGQLVLKGVSVGVPDAAAAQGAMQQVTGAGGSKPSLHAAGSAAAGGPGFVVAAWNTSLTGWSLGATSTLVPASNGARLVMQDVTVLETPSVCKQQQQQEQQQQSSTSSGSSTAAVWTEGHLLAALSDADVSRVVVTDDITLTRDFWQGQQLRLRRPVVVLGCRSSAGAPVVLDFSQLQGEPVLVVSSLLRFSSSLELRGLPDAAGVAGSWVFMPLVDLQGPGSLEFQGVQMQGFSQSLLQQLERQASGLPLLAQLNSSNMLVHRLLINRSAAAQLLPNTTGSTGGSSKSRSMLAVAPFSSNTGINTASHSNSRSSSSRGLLQAGSVPNSAAYYSWVGTEMHWAPRPAASSTTPHGLTEPGAVAAVVLGCVLGLLLLLLAVLGLLLQRRRRRHLLHAWGLGEAPEKDRGCWGLCGGVSGDPSHQLPPCVAGIGYPEFNHSWRQHQIPPGASVLASFGSAQHPYGNAQQPYGDTSMHGGRVFFRSNSDGVANPNTVGMSGYAVQTSPASATTTRSYRGPGGGEAAAAAALANLCDLGYLQQQQGLDVEQGGAPYGIGSAARDRLLASAAGNTTARATSETTDAEGDAGGNRATAGGGGGQHKQQVFEAARRQLGATAGDLARSDALVLEAVLGEGSFGKVFRGYWKGTLVAVKTMMFPAAMSGKEKREKMAIMETAISASLSHPNIVQMYTYYLRPVLVGHEATLTGGAAEEAARLDSSSVGDSTMNAAFLNEGLADSVHSWEVQLVLEYCDKGSLRALLNKQGTFMYQDGRRDMVMILDTALDVARAMVHLHSENIIHSDLKARNILLKSSGGAEGRPFVAKVADFGLSMRIDPNATHVSNVYQGTMTHMAPEVMLRGKLSRQSDVYAFGVLLWELYSGGHAFKGIPRALLGHEVAHQQRRPQFPDDCPFDFQLLACRCWESDASIRPSFSEILAELLRMRERMTAAAAAEQAANASCTVLQLSDAAAAGEAAAGAAAAGTGGLRPQSEPLQAPHMVTALPAAAASDPVHGFKVSGTAAAAGAVAASAAAVAAAAAAAAAFGVHATPTAAAAGDAAAGDAEVAPAADTDAAAAAGQQQPGQAPVQLASTVTAAGAVGTSGRLHTHSIPLLLPVLDETTEQPQQQLQQQPMQPSQPVQQQQPVQQPSSEALPDLSLPLPQQQQQLSQEEQKALAYHHSHLHQQQQQHHHHPHLHDRLSDVHRAAAMRRASDSMTAHHQAILDDLLLQVSLTGGSSLCAGNIVMGPPTAGQQQHSQPLPQAISGQQQQQQQQGGGPGEGGPGGVGHPGVPPAPSAAAAEGAAAGVDGVRKGVAPAAEAAAAAIGGGGELQEHQKDRSAYLGDSSSSSACGPGVMVYGATRHRHGRMWVVQGSTQTSDEAQGVSGGIGSVAAGAAAAAAAVVAAGGSKQQGQHADGDRSSEHDQGQQHLGIAATGNEQQQQQGAAVVDLEQPVVLPPAEPAAASADVAGATPATAAGAETSIPRAGADAGAEKPSALRSRSPASSKSGSLFGNTLQQLSQSARRLFSRSGGSQSGTKAAAAAGGGRRGTASGAAAAALDPRENMSLHGTAQHQQHQQQQQQAREAVSAAAGVKSHVDQDIKQAVQPGYTAATPQGFEELLQQQQQQLLQLEHSAAAVNNGQLIAYQAPGPVAHWQVQQQQQQQPAALIPLPPTLAAAAAAGAAAMEPTGPIGHQSHPQSSVTQEASGGSRSVTVYSSGGSGSAHGSGNSGSSHSGSYVQDSSSSDQDEQASETAAALAAVMSLKTLLAKQAFAGGIPRPHADNASSGQPAAAAGTRLSCDAGLAAAAAAAAAVVAAAAGDKPPYRHSVDVVLPGTAAAAAAAAAGLSALPGAGAVAPYSVRPSQQWGPAAGTGVGMGVGGHRAPLHHTMSGPLTPAPSLVPLHAEPANAAAAAARRPPSPAVGAGMGFARAGGVSFGPHGPQQQQQQEGPGTSSAVVSPHNVPPAPLPLHVIAQQLSLLEGRSGLAAPRPDAVRRLSVDAATQQQQAAATAAAAAAAPSGQGPAGSRSWHTGLANLATQLLQPSLLAPRSPKPQQQQQQQQQRLQQQHNRLASMLSPSGNWKPPVRKTVSASQLGAGRGAGLAASPATTPGASGGLPPIGFNGPNGPLGLHTTPSQPLPPMVLEESTQFGTGSTGIHPPPSGRSSEGGVGAAAAGIPGMTGRASIQLSLTGQQQQQQRLQQQRMSLQLPLPLQVGGQEGPGDQLAVAGLDPIQLQLLAQIADAARAQVSPLSIANTDTQQQQQQQQQFADTDSLAMQQRWRSAPTSGSGDPLLMLRQPLPTQQQQQRWPPPAPQQQQRQQGRPRPQHTASFNLPGVRLYGTSSAAMAATAGPAAAATPGSGVPPMAPVQTGTGPWSGQVSPSGKPRRSSAPAITPEQRQQYMAHQEQLLQQYQQQHQPRQQQQQ